ncbi:hypothetical protein C8R43DRAFT_515159 [Mycena crocata]|nr:hypothetical protein C8R43DRAFT_515159 [Mycena crocata]
MTTLELYVIVYGSCSCDPDNDDRFGSEQRRVEITLTPTIPAHATTGLKKYQWLQEFLVRIEQDMKYNRNWRCEFCRKHAREVVWQNASWLSRSPPRAQSYVHNICNSETGPCAEQSRNVTAEMGRQTGCPPTSLPREPKPNSQAKYPLSSSCAVCHNDAEESRRNLKQCSKCELTRYCSVECQRTDWSRHKECCKAVKEVNWHWD